MCGGHAISLQFDNFFIEDRFGRGLADAMQIVNTLTVNDKLSGVQAQVCGPSKRQRVDSNRGNRWADNGGIAKASGSQSSGRAAKVPVQKQEHLAEFEALANAAGGASTTVWSRTPQ